MKEQFTLVGLLATIFALLWFFTYVSYHHYTSSLKESIDQLKLKIKDIERDALMSLVRLSKETSEEQRKNQQLVDLLIRELTLLFEQSEQALSLGLTHSNPTIRNIAEKVVIKRSSDE